MERPSDNKILYAFTAFAAAILLGIGFAILMQPLTSVGLH